MSEGHAPELSAENAFLCHIRHKTDTERLEILEEMCRGL